MASSRYNAGQVCSIVTGEGDDLEYMFPGSDDDPGMGETGEIED